MLTRHYQVPYIHLAVVGRILHRHAINGIGPEMRRHFLLPQCQGKLFDFVVGICTPLVLQQCYEDWLRIPRPSRHGRDCLPLYLFIHGELWVRFLVKCLNLQESPVSREIPELYAALLKEAIPKSARAYASHIRERERHQQDAPLIRSSKNTAAKSTDTSQ